MKAQWIQGSFSGRFFFRSRVTYFISNPGILSLKKIVSFSFVLSLSIYMYIILMFAYVFVYLCLCYFVIYYTHMCLRCLESIHLRSITNDSWCSNHNYDRWPGPCRRCGIPIWFCFWGRVWMEIPPSFSQSIWRPWREGVRDSQG